MAIDTLARINRLKGKGDNEEFFFFFFLKQRDRVKDQ